MTLLINALLQEFIVRKFNIYVVEIVKKGLNQLRHLSGLSLKYSENFFHATMVSLVNSSLSFLISSSY